MKVRYTVGALDDSREIYLHLLEQSPSGARHVMERIDRAVEMIAAHPLVGILTDIEGVRVVQVARYPYRIFYSHAPGVIEVIHIRHTARTAPTGFTDSPQAMLDPV